MENNGKLQITNNKNQIASASKNLPCLDTNSKVGVQHRHEALSASIKTQKKYTDSFQNPEFLKFAIKYAASYFKMDFFSAGIDFKQIQNIVRIWNSKKDPTNQISLGRVKFNEVASKSGNSNKLNAEDIRVKFGISIQSSDKKQELKSAESALYNKEFAKYLLKKLDRHGGVINEFGIVSESRNFAKITGIQLVFDEKSKILFRKLSTELEDKSGLTNGDLLRLTREQYYNSSSNQEVKNRRQFNLSKLEINKQVALIEKLRADSGLEKTSDLLTWSFRKLGDKIIDNCAAKIARKFGLDVDTTQDLDKLQNNIKNLSLKCINALKNNNPGEFDKNFNKLSSSISKFESKHSKNDAVCGIVSTTLQGLVETLAICAVAEATGGAAAAAASARIAMFVARFGRYAKLAKSVGTAATRYSAVATTGAALRSGLDEASALQAGRQRTKEERTTSAVTGAVSAVLGTAGNRAENAIASRVTRASLKQAKANGLAKPARNMFVASRRKVMTPLGGALANGPSSSLETLATSGDTKQAIEDGLVGAAVGSAGGAIAHGLSKVKIKNNNNNNFSVSKNRHSSQRSYEYDYLKEPALLHTQVAKLENISTTDITESDKILSTYLSQTGGYFFKLNGSSSSQGILNFSISKDGEFNIEIPNIDDNDLYDLKKVYSSLAFYNNKKLTSIDIDNIQYALKEIAFPNISGVEKGFLIRKSYECSKITFTDPKSAQTISALPEARFHFVKNNTGKWEFVGSPVKLVDSELGATSSDVKFHLTLEETIAQALKFNNIPFDQNKLSEIANEFLEISKLQLANDSSIYKNSPDVTVDLLLNFKGNKIEAFPLGLQRDYQFNMLAEQNLNSALRIANARLADNYNIFPRRFFMKSFPEIIQKNLENYRQNPPQISAIESIDASQSPQKIHPTVANTWNQKAINAVENSPNLDELKVRIQIEGICIYKDLQDGSYKIYTPQELITGIDNFQKNGISDGLTRTFGFRDKIVHLKNNSRPVEISRHNNYRGTEYAKRASDALDRVNPVQVSRNAQITDSGLVVKNLPGHGEITFRKYEASLFENESPLAIYIDVKITKHTEEELRKCIEKNLEGRVSCWAFWNKSDPNLANKIWHDMKDSHVLVLSEQSYNKRVETAGTGAYNDRGTLDIKVNGIFNFHTLLHEQFHVACNTFQSNLTYISESHFLDYLDIIDEGLTERFSAISTKNSPTAYKEALWVVETLSKMEGEEVLTDCYRRRTIAPLYRALAERHGPEVANLIMIGIFSSKSASSGNSDLLIKVLKDLYTNQKVNTLTLKDYIQHPNYRYAFKQLIKYTIKNENVKPESKKQLDKVLKELNKYDGFSDEQKKQNAIIIINSLIMIIGLGILISKTQDKNK